MLNHFASLRTTPPILPPAPIQSAIIGMKETFRFGGIRPKISGFQTAMLVVVTGYDLGVGNDGGYAAYVRVPADWVVKLPSSLTPFDAMAIGTAGFTAALSVIRLEQNGLVHQLDGITFVVVLLREKALERVRQLVRINNERLHADIDQMIEGEADERLLENRNERLGQIIGERSQTRAESGTEDECLCD